MNFIEVDIYSADRAPYTFYDVSLSYLTTNTLASSMITLDANQEYYGTVKYSDSINDRSFSSKLPKFSKSSLLCMHVLAYIV